MIVSRGPALVWLGVACIGLAACDDSAPARSVETSTSIQVRTPDIRAAGGYRIMGTPVAGVATTSNGITTAVVTIRTSKPLPFRDPAVTANIRLDGASGVSPAIRVGHRARHCYTQPVDEFPRSAHTGDPTRLTIKIPGVRQQLRMTLRFASAKVAARQSKALCGRRTIFDEPDNAP